MYVVEAAAVSAETMKISVISLGGARWTVDVLPEFTIDKLKLMALSHFYNPMDSIKVADRYKLILVSDSRPLSDEGTVRDENIQDDDELLLLKRRFPLKPAPETTKEKEEKNHGPTDEEIQKYTAGLTPKNMDVAAEEAPLVSDFQSEWRKILISLVTTSEKMLRHHPDILKLFRDANDDEDQMADAKSVDDDALKQLVDMGFPEESARSALTYNNDAESAAEWLITQGAENMPCSSSSEPKLILEDSDSSCESSDTRETSSTSSEPPIRDSCAENPVVKMLQRFRAYKRKMFKPNRAALNSLKEMGFAESDVLDALRINGNNQDSACDWLLSDKKLNYEDLDRGLDPDGPIYRAIMDNAIVQLGLCNPKTFLALLHMLENPNNTCRWLSDPDAAPILSQIFRIYHAEKHTIQLARPFMQ